MTRHFFTSAFTRRGRRAWLMCLALLWPLAGTAALLHGYGHLQAALSAGGPQVSQPSSGDPDLNAHAPQSCDLCLAAAASLLGAAPVTPCALPLLPPPAARVFTRAVAPPVRFAGPHFSARAPPLS